MDWQNQYCENGYTTKSELYVQSNSYQNSNDIFYASPGSPKDLIYPKPEQNSNTRGVTISDFKLYYRAIVIILALYK
jgi:hypothetical protein